MNTIKSLYTKIRLYPSAYKNILALNALNHYNKFHATAIKMAPNALIILADGAEEMEAIITADVLRRAAVSLL